MTHEREKGNTIPGLRISKYSRLIPKCSRSKKWQPVFGK